MKKIRFLLFTLLALFYVTNANALIVGNRFERDGITYEVTAMEEAHDGLPKRFNVKFVSSKMWVSPKTQLQVYTLKHIIS